MRYFGGKNKLGKHITNIINNFIGEDTIYVEPFCGSMGLMLTLKTPKYALINDNHSYLMKMWSAVIHSDWLPSDEWKPTSYEQYLKEGEEIYEKLKPFKDSKSVGMIKLNPAGYSDAFVGYFGFASCFAGKWFGGFARSGNGRPSIHFMATMKLLKIKIENLKKIEKIKLFCGSYSKLLKMNIKDGVYYLDPPYLNTTGYSTGKIDYDEFWENVRECSKFNMVFVSEENAPDDFVDIMNKTYVRGMTGGNGKNVVVKERLFIHKTLLDNFKYKMLIPEEDGKK